MNAKTRQWVLEGLAAVIVLTALLKAWASAHGVSVGLWSVEVCANGCHSFRWDNVPGAQDDLYMAGYLAFGAALLGAAAIVAFVLGSQGAAKFGRAVLLIAFLGMLYFIIRGFALDALNGLSIGWAAFVGPLAVLGARHLLRPS
jgi:hypothetical protein